MADPEVKEAKVGTHLSAESMRMIAESVGISGLNDEVATYLAEDVTFRLKGVVQVCRSSMLNHYSVSDGDFSPSVCPVK